MGVEALIGMAGTAAYGAYKGYKNKKNAKRDQQANTDFQNQTLGRLNPRIDAAQGRSDAGYADLQSRYKGLLDNPGGNYNSRGLPGFTEFSNTGGWDDAARGDVEGNINQWAELARGEGANKTFKEFSETGGWNEADKTNFRGRTAAQVPSFYSGLSKELQRKSAVNPYALGLDDASSQLARESARGSADAVRDSEIGLSESIRSGRLAGAEGYTSSVLQSLNAKNAARMGMQNSINQGRQFGISGLEDVSQNEYAASQRDTELGLEGLADLQGMDVDQLMQLLGMSTGVSERGLDRQLGLNQRNDTQQSALLDSVLGGILNQGMAGRANRGTAYGRGRINPMRG